MASKTPQLSSLTDRPAATVNLIGGRLCLDFVNSVGARRPTRQGKPLIRDEKLNGPADVVAWALHAGAIRRTEARALYKLAASGAGDATRMFRAALALREALHRILKASLVGLMPDRDDLACLNTWTLRARSAKRIRARNRRFGWVWVDPAVSFAKILWLISESAADLLLTGDLSRLRQCSGDDCGWIFEDTTRNHSRQWCDTRDCGNRDRVRRFRLNRRRGREGHLGRPTRQSEH
jgi:predicted RNA-binding Zn ribbon-like protein